MNAPAAGSADIMGPKQRPISNRVPESKDKKSKTPAVVFVPSRGSAVTAPKAGLRPAGPAPTFPKTQPQPGPQQPLTPPRKKIVEVRWSSSTGKWEEHRIEPSQASASSVQDRTQQAQAADDKTSDCPWKRRHYDASRHDGSSGRIVRPPARR